MTLLADIAVVSQRVARTSSRLEKTRELADCLRCVAPDEIPIAIAYLSGETLQGKLGVAYGTLQSVRHQPPAANPSVTLAEVDAAFTGLAAVAGRGSAAAREARLAALFARATAL